jgi:hypothetical protein
MKSWGGRRKDKERGKKRQGEKSSDKRKKKRKRSVVKRDRKKERKTEMRNSEGDFHDQGDAEWIVIRRSLWGHNCMPFGRPTPGRPIGWLGVGLPQGIMGGFSYYWLVMLISNIILKHCPPDLGINTKKERRDRRSAPAQAVGRSSIDVSQTLCAGPG